MFWTLLGNIRYLNSGVRACRQTCRMHFAVVMFVCHCFCVWLLNKKKGSFVLHRNPFPCASSTHTVQRQRTHTIMCIRLFTYDTRIRISVYDTCQHHHYVYMLLPSTPHHHAYTFIVRSNASSYISSNVCSRLLVVRAQCRVTNVCDGP